MVIDVENSFPQQVERFSKALLERGRSPITAREYRTHLAQLAATSGKLRLEEITPDDLERFAAECRASGNYQQASSAARSFFKWAHQTGLIKENIGERLIPEVQPKRPIEEYVWLTFSQQKALLDSCPGPFERLVIMFFIGMGCRNGQSSPRREFCGIQWEDIDFDRNHIKIHGKGRGKEGKIRYAHFDEGLKELLLAYKTPDSKGRFGAMPIYKKPQEVVNLVRELATKAGLTRLAQTKHPVHALKHTFCTNWVLARRIRNVSEDLRGLSTQVGTEIETLEVYIHIAEEYLKSSYNETMKMVMEELTL